MLLQEYYCRTTKKRQNYEKKSTNIAILVGSFLATYSWVTYVQSPNGSVFVAPSSIAIISSICTTASMGYTMLKRSTKIKIDMTLISMVLSCIGLFCLECVLVSAHIIQGPEGIRHLVHASGPGSSTMNTIANLIFWGIGVSLTFGVAIPKLTLKDGIKHMRKLQAEERCNLTVS